MIFISFRWTISSECVDLDNVAYFSSNGANYCESEDVRL